MKLRLTLKDPDGVGNCLYDHAEQSTVGIEGLSSEEMTDLMNSRMESAREYLKKWIKWDEYISIEIDMETGEIKVLPVD